MQQIRKRKPTARQGMIAAKPARNRRSAEQMLVELKRRLREASDLTAAGDVLNWDQATYMPRGGADARGRQCAVISRLAHEQAVSPSRYNPKSPASENTSSALGHATSVRKVMARTPLEPKEVGPFDLAGLPGGESLSSSGAPGGRLRVHVLG